MARWPGPGGGERRGESVSFWSRRRGYGSSSRARAPDRPGDALLGGGSYTAPPPAESHAIVNAYTLAFFDRYLRGAVARDGWLAENHYGDAVVLEAKTG